MPSAIDTDLAAHSVTVRVTHWITTASFLCLLISGGAILVAHPRFYWGETGDAGGPSLFDLPIPFIFGLSGWGRYLHFLAAWASVITGAVYLAYCLLAGEERARQTYNRLQRMTYLSVVFILFPLMTVTGLAMSPAITSVAPWLATMFGGHQSARTLHFFSACALVAFLLGHVTMVLLAGVKRLRTMIV
jgi:thiosulfate reductase cytochrome b subunit